MVVIEVVVKVAAHRARTTREKERSLRRSRVLMEFKAILEFLRVIFHAGMVDLALIELWDTMIKLWECPGIL